MNHLYGLLEHSSHKFPDRPALQEINGSRITYSQLDEYAGEVNTSIAKLGITNQRIGILSTKNIGKTAILFGILKSGNAYVPIDTSAPEDRIGYIIEHCGLSLIIVQSGHLPILDQFDLSERGKFNIGEVEYRILKPSFTTETVPNPENLAYILYTSGSTGNPKGVTVTNANALAFIDWCSSVFKPNGSDVFSSHAPFHFDLSVLDIFLPIKHGANLILINDLESKQPKLLTEIIEKYSITIWYSTPTILKLMLGFGKPDQFRSDSLRLVLFAGEVFPITPLNVLREIWTSAEYFNLYGPTETNVCTYYQLPQSIEREREEPHPIGKVCGHYEALILSKEMKPLSEVGEQGSLFMNGPGVTNGYWSDIEKTEEVFHSFNEKKWYNTGDWVEIGENGNYIFRGRLDRMVKRRGYRIELGDIENRLIQHPLIEEICTVPVTDPKGEIKLIAHIVATGETGIPFIEMKKYCMENLVNYMIPDKFVYHTSLPKTSTAKTDYQALINLG